MGRNKLVLERSEQEETDEKEDPSVWGVPICGGNLSTPVLDQAYYIDEIHYKIAD